ncbi:M12 family metallopeptidase [uncultured Aquimarina sp.]|uniref:M12 family metallopeptidase n=1 Tax=uncultured Aquimarina sp. TaxID=575652 RepID=UPI00260840DE|nr:M12 family metallopeptidase [uncultured Aquimarina sp.]
MYYQVQNGFPNQQRITDAIADWEAKTPIRFVPRTNQNNYVFFRTGGGCSSFVGRQGGRQDITLAGGCPTGAVIHEIGHAVGLWHEQSRKDRDQYITINFGNIQNGLEFNFETYLQQGIDGDEFTNELDFNSIMLYSSFAFSKNGLPTIVKKDGSTYTTNRTSLSNGDVEGIQKMYSGDGPGGDICDGVAEWSPNQSYQPGDRVTYFGNLFERTTNGWNFIGSCGTSNTKSSDTDFKDLNDVDLG